MPSLDATAQAALARSGFAVAFFIFADISGDPLRITTHGGDVSFASTGDADLDGHTFTAFDGRALSVSPVSNSEAGSDTVTVELSGILGVDTTLLNDIGNRALWQGRSFRQWFALYSPDGTTQQGAIVPQYTGYMSEVELIDDAKTQTIRLSVENYLAAFSQASNRSYMNQVDYDAADTSAAATLAAANLGRAAASNVSDPQSMRNDGIPGNYRAFMTNQVGAH